MYFFLAKQACSRLNESNLECIRLFRLTHVYNDIQSLQGINLLQTEWGIEVNHDCGSLGAYKDAMITMYIVLYKRLMNTIVQPN